ncbi:XdhC family protein [Paenibacillus xerothermodurans]|uniref:XdhC family protein n=1 Tax=Paenibacillus xerothermodurans TaxID=1977292 RepID=A0A2W1N870_PAEXE|nr:XdhC family protein [Paenibacillus xerothermodurans]PZE20759.1 XdhC family protein [Paenibacillus xerothermodurans]
MVEILHGLQNCWANKERAALATIVEVKGAAYRREGARCLICESGSMIGTLSGGCVEGDLVEHARQVIEQGESREIRYDFGGEGDLLWGLGVGCNGAVTVWLQPFDPVRFPDQAQQIVQAFAQRVSCTEAYTAGIVLESDDPIGTPVGSHRVLERQGDSSRRWFRDRCGLVYDRRNGAAVKWFAETVTPRTRLVIYGAGSGAVPLIAGARKLQWHVTLIDHREEHLKQDLFSQADERVLILRDEYSEYSINLESYAVVMTHNYELDRKLIESLLPGDIAYLGVLGSRDRIVRILHDIRLSGKEWNEDWLTKLHAPIGLDIGADSPEEIALSILSELLCRKNGRSGQSLKLREEPMHERYSAVEPLMHEWVPKQGSFLNERYPAGQYSVSGRLHPIRLALVNE